MSTSSHKGRVKTLAGMSSREAKKKLDAIWMRDHADTSLNRANKDFHAAHGMYLLAVCEIWHKLRSYNFSVEAMIQAFAEKISSGNKHRAHLEGVIRQQRAELAKNAAYIGHLQKELSRHGTSPESLKQESAQGQTPQVAEREDAEISEANGTT